MSDKLYWGNSGASERKNETKNETKVGHIRQKIYKKDLAIDSQRTQIIQEEIINRWKSSIYQVFVILSKGSLSAQTNFCKGLKQF